ncbi:Tic22 family protein [Spirulina subsalsa]|uniref:Tic22 family protein n=1 Tax=Spirulina subsalsa TaxID=54311 RepID=UPI00030197F6|nr:Tic22 family protein [Spirulina subsalsa]
MMKSLLRRFAVLGIAGAAMAGTLFGGALEVLALTEQEIVERLQNVPVFTVADREGKPLVAQVDADNPSAGSVAGVFISPQDAERFVQNLKRDNPTLGNQVQVVVVSLAEIYQLDRQASQNTQANFGFTYVPTEQQVQQARQLSQDFQGTPLFVARGGPEQGYLTLQQGEEQVIPFFFDKQQLQQMIERFKEQEPSLASTVSIQAVPLEGVIQAMETSNNAGLNQIVLVPSQSAIQYIQSRQPR